MIQHIRWQALIAFSGIALMLTMLGYLSTNLETVVLPERGGTYIEGIPDRPATINPLYLQATNRADHDLAALLFNGLTRTDVTGTILPDLATRWDISDDSRTYTFHLRDDVRWHDGAPFTAADVAYTVSVIQAPAFAGTVPAIELWREVQVEVVDPHTIRFTLPEDVAPFAPFLSFTTFGLLPSHLLAGVPVAELPDVPFNRFPIGTGPWRVVRVEGEQIVLEPHPAFHGERPMLERLILRFYDGEDETMQALRRGDVMGVARVRPDDLTRVLADPSLVPYSSLMSGYTAIFFNLRNPMFQQHEVREAMLRGLDRQAIVQDVLDGQGIVAHSFLPPTHWAYDDSLPRYPYQPDEARRLLDQAGWIDSDGDGVRERLGVPMRFTVLTIGSEPRLVEVVERVAEQWAELGMAAEPEIVSSAAALWDTLRTREFDLFILATPETGLPPDPDFYPLWHSSQIAETGQNYTSFTSEEADLLLTEGRFQLDPQERRAIYQEFQAMVARDLPALPLYHPIYNYAVKDIVRDVQLGPMVSPSDRFQTLADWYIKTERVLRERVSVPPAPGDTATGAHRQR